MMRIIWTRHARNRLRRARISQEEVERLIEGTPLAEMQSRARLNRWYDWGDGLVRLVLVEEADGIVVISVIWPAATENGDMKLEYDAQADAIYIRLKETDIATTREVEDNLVIDLDSDGKMVGIELLFVSDYLDPDDVASFTVSNLRATA